MLRGGHSAPMARAGWHPDPTPPEVVTGASCGDLLAAYFLNSGSPEKRKSIQKAQATHSDLAGFVVNDREAQLVQNHEDRDPVSVWLASTGLCHPFRVPAVRFERHVSPRHESAFASCRRGAVGQILALGL